MKPDGRLPEDLDRLGVYLEAAAAQTVRRRRRRQALMNSVATVILSLPFALAVAAADLSPSDSVLPSRPTPVTFPVQPQPTAFRVVGNVPDQPFPSTNKDRCPDARDCRPAQPTRYRVNPGQR
jgi:hypothetical protein